MKAAVLAAASHLAAVDANATVLPALDERLKAFCQPPRRVDRFVKLALLGAAKCVGTRELQPTCGVYVGSTYGPLSSNIRVQTQLLQHHQLPKPFDFVNTLGTSAGFYVANHFGLAGPSVFVSRFERSLEAAVEAALLDLAVGAVEQALVGLVEEAPLPARAQRRRLQLEDEVTVAEGSHWLLLGQSGPGAAPRELTLERPHDWQGLTSGIAARSPDIAVCLGKHVAPEAAQAVRRLFPQALGSEQLTLPFHSEIESAWFVRRAAEQAPGATMLVGGDAPENACLLHLGP